MPEIPFLIDKAERINDNVYRFQLAGTGKGRGHVSFLLATF
jgi:hypothetical protein